MNLIFQYQVTWLIKYENVASISNAYRLFVPVVNEIEERAMDDEQDVDENKEVVWIPESIVACEPIKWLRQLNKTPPKPPCSQCKGNYHENQHENPCNSLNPFNKIHVFWPVFTKVLNHVKVVYGIGLVCKPWKVTGKMVSGMEYDTNYNGCSYSLLVFKKGRAKTLIK